MPRPSNTSTLTPHSKLYNMTREKCPIALSTNSGQSVGVSSNVQYRQYRQSQFSHFVPTFSQSEVLSYSIASAVGFCYSAYVGVVFVCSFVVEYGKITLLSDFILIVVLLISVQFYLLVGAKFINAILDIVREFLHIAFVLRYSKQVDKHFSLTLDDNVRGLSTFGYYANADVLPCWYQTPPVRSGEDKITQIIIYCPNKFLYHTIYFFRQFVVDKHLLHY